jgi:CRISPR-associated protein Csb2
MILQLEVIFTAGHFHGDEWPPAPARLFQALVAASHQGAHGLIHQSGRDEALRWLERQPPPAILAPEAVRQRDHLVNYVPNNDDEFQGLDNSGYDRSHVRTDKSLGGWFLPAPLAVTFRWELTGTPEDRRCSEVLCAMVSLLSYIGRTGDSVHAVGRVLETVPSSEANGRSHWRPLERDGGRWLAPAPGFLDLLNRRFPRSVSAEPPDFTNTRQVDYATGDEIRFDAPIAVFEMLRLDADKKLAFAPRDLRQAAGMVRDAMLQWAAANPAIPRHFGPDRIARFLQGHKSATSPERSEGGHFAVVPLPSINPPAFTADGWIRHVALLGLGLASDADRELFHELTRGLHGASLRDNGVPRGELRLLTPRGQQRGLLRHFNGPARRWRSLTPVVLTGFTRRGRSAETCLARAFVQQGFAQEHIESLATFSGPIVPTAQRARDYHVQGYLATTPRVHAEVIFRQQVAGPLVIGRGRFTGLGLFVPAGPGTTG